VMERFRIVSTLLFATGAGLWLASFAANALTCRGRVFIFTCPEAQPGSVFWPTPE
jgi:hypothetical protein